MTGSLLTAEDMAARLGHSAWWWLNEARCKRVPHFKQGRVVRWTEQDVAQIVEAHRVTAVSEMDALRSQSQRSRSASRRRSA